MLPNRVIPPSQFWLLLALVLSAPVSAQQQQSYRSYERLSGRVLRSVDKPGKDFSQRKAPMPFQGWKHPGKFAPDYLKHFSRPGARQMRAEILTGAARAETHSNGLAPQAVPPLHGLLLRDSLPAGYIPTSVGGWPTL